MWQVTRSPATDEASLRIARSPTRRTPVPGGRSRKESLTTSRRRPRSMSKFVISPPMTTPSESHRCPRPCARTSLISAVRSRPRRCCRRSIVYPRGRVKRAGATRSSWRHASSASCRRARPTVATTASRPPASRHKTLEDFDFSYQRSVRKEVVVHLGTLDFVEARDNVIFLGPPGTGKSHLAIALGIRACQAGHRVAFGTAARWVDRLGEAHHKGLLHDELVRLGRTPLLIIDEVGYIPFEAEVVSLKGDSYRLKDRDLGRVPNDDAA